MAASGYTPISLYYSTTASAVPTAGNLANGELALNIADMKLYAKNSSGVVTLLASNAATSGVSSVSFGSTGLTPSTATSGAVTVAGTLATTNGGTGLTSFTSGGVVYASSTSALATGSALTFDGTTLGVTGPLNLAGTSTFPTSGLMLRSADNQLKVVAGSAGIAFAAASGASTFGMFDSAGNLGLGVTPSAWSAHKVLQVGAWSSFGSYNGNLNAQMMNNAYWDGSAYRYIGSSQASYFSTVQGSFQWNTAASGTAGNAISFTQAMTLNESGELLLGTTSSASSACSIQAKTSGYSIWSINDATLNYSQFYFGGTATSGFQFIRSDGRSGGWLAFGTQDTERFRIGSAGQWGIGGANYGTAGQVLTSAGSGSAPTWSAVAGGSQAFVAFGSTGGL